MSTPPNRTPNRFQFTLRFALLLITAACLMLGFLHWMMPSDLPVAGRGLIYATFLGALGFAAVMSLRAKQNPWEPASDFVVVKVDVRWERRVKSPLVAGPIAALTGVSLSFAPAALLWCGQVEQYGLAEWIIVPASFLTIYLVPGFYMSLASEVIAQLLRPRDENGEKKLPQNV